MTERVRVLNEKGLSEFTDWLVACKGGSITPPPLHLMNDKEFSEDLDPAVKIDREPEGKKFESRYELGMYLKEKFSAHSKTDISRNSGLWNWLSLYYIDQLAPPASSGARTIFELEVYRLSPEFKFQKYYRHAIRSPWLAAYEHGEASRVLLVPPGKANAEKGVLTQRGDIFEQLASRQSVFGSNTVIAAIDKLYVDPLTGRPKRGTAGKGGGSPRRLTTVIQQLDMTYDLPVCTIDQIIALLPKDFDKWKDGDLKKAS